MEEQDSSADLFDSCLYNIVDGDELTIEPVNVTVDTKSRSIRVFIVSSKIDTLKCYAGDIFETHFLLNTKTVLSVSIKYGNV